MELCVMRRSGSVLTNKACSAACPDQSPQCSTLRAAMGRKEQAAPTTPTPKVAATCFHTNGIEGITATNQGNNNGILLLLAPVINAAARQESQKSLMRRDARACRANTIEARAKTAEKASLPILPAWRRKQ